MISNPFQSSKPKRPVNYTNDSILEAIRDLSGGVGKTVTKDLAGKVGSDALTSLFGSLPRQGEMRPNQAVTIPERQARQEPRPERSHPAVGRPEMSPVSRPIIREDQQKLAVQIESVRQELKAIAASIQSLNAEIGKAVQAVPVNPGIYHANYFDHLKSILKVLREQIDDSRSWLAMHSDRKKKKGYWGMFKKHGTSFGLSNERSLATSAG
jgi:hypothetical protein